MKDWLNSWIKWCAIGAFEQNMKIYIWLKSPNIIEKFFQLYSWIKWGVGGAVPPTHLAQLLDTTTWSTTLSAGHNHLVNHWVHHLDKTTWTQPPYQLDTITWSTTLSTGHSNLVHQLDIHLVNHLVTWSPGHHLINYLVRYTHPPCHQDTTTWTTTLSPSHLDKTTWSAGHNHLANHLINHGHDNEFWWGSAKRELRT